MVRKAVFGEYVKIFMYGKVEESLYDEKSKFDLWVNEENFIHNINEPALIEYWDEMKTIFKTVEYGNNGIISSINGPARIKYYKDGGIWNLSYFINSEPYSKEEWEIEANRIKMLEEL